MGPSFYPSSDDLWAGLRLCDEASLWHRPCQRWTLTAGDRTAWLLDIDATLPGAVTDGLEVDDQRVRQQVDGVITDYTVTARHSYDALWQAVPPAPRTGPEPEVTFFELTGAEAFREVARANLMLGNDRLRFLPLQGDRVLLRVEQLSAFLREKWRAEPQFVVYHAGADGRLLLPAGWVHPLADKLSLGAEDDDLWLLDSDGGWRHIAGALHDIYERIAIQPVGVVPVTVAPLSTIEPVEVQLRLEPTETTERPQLWRLEPAQQPVLERLLREATEEELNNLQIAAVQGADGRPWLLLVERLTSVARLAPPVHGGLAYYPRLAVEHLYLPAGQRLAPVLARRSLAEALGLSDEHLTLLDVQPDGRLHLTRIPRQALRPVLDIVDYFAAQAAEEVVSLLDRVSLDLELAADRGDDAEAAPAAGFWDRLRRWLGGQPRG